MAAVAALDTSTLMMPVEVGVRPFDELERLLAAVEPVTIPAVIAELERLAGGSGEAARAARVGADLASERCRIVGTQAPAETDSADGNEDVDGRSGDVTGRSDGGDADDALVALARSGAVDYVVTNDRPLANRVLAAGVPVIGLRGRNKLGITRP